MSDNTSPWFLIQSVTEWLLQVISPFWAWLSSFPSSLIASNTNGCTEVCNPRDLYQVTQSHSQTSNLSKCHVFALLMQLEDRSPTFQLSLQLDYHPKTCLGRKSGVAVIQHFLSTSPMRHWAEEKQTHIMKCGRQQHIQITVKLSVKQGLLERHKLRQQVLGEGRINSVGILLKSSQKSIVCGGAQCLTEKSWEQGGGVGSDWVGLAGATPMLLPVWH